MLTDSSLADLRAALEQERASLQQRLDELGEGDAGSLAFDQNFADTSQVTAERGEVEAVTGSLKESLAEVQDALAKFERGAFGTCERCGEAIAIARLEAKPAARLCMACASVR